ncbi:hypothetical protein DL95DRAFT_417143 [Leptodontidium sp. 2 PMI_412]|nr:hypothetical protein DL95DRAFT_417143 [Leptodontidium sp. 2 PMI_412]
MAPVQDDSSGYVKVWLEKINSSDPAVLHNQDDQDSTTPLSSTSPSPSSPSPFILHSLAEIPKRKRRMNSDTASNASGGTTRTGATTTSFQNRPILRPTPPSSRQRSPSPTRKARAATYGEKAEEHSDQQAVRRSDSLQSPVQAQLLASDPDQFQALSHLFENPAIVHPASYTDRLWDVADKIYNEARRCHDNHLDESAWMKVVNNVLDSTELGEETSMLHVHSIQTQSVDPTLLPIHTSQSFAKKADLAFAFSSDHPSVAAAIEPVQKANPDLCLSQMTDAYTSTVPLACCLEVKEQGGDYNESILQLGIWCAAGLERLRGLRTLGKSDSGSGLEEELPPFLGWTVVGHDWKFHISWKDEDGNVIVLGPWRSLNAGTSSHAEILILMALIRAVKDWLEKEYWVWMCRNVLDGLK